MIDKAKLLEALTSWNYWKIELPDTVARQIHYPHQHVFLDEI